MPLGQPKWSANRSATFANWASNGYPLGTATAPAPDAMPFAAAPPARLRKNRKLSVEIEVLDQEELGGPFPLSRAGDPTINARLLLEEP